MLSDIGLTNFRKFDLVASVLEFLPGLDGVCGLLVGGGAKDTDL
jgi:hypothetical protein